LPSVVVFTFLIAVSFVRGALLIELLLQFACSDIVSVGELTVEVMTESINFIHNPFNSKAYFSL